MTAEGSFWDHLDELRSTLVRSLAIVFAGFVLCLLFHQQIFQALASPLEAPSISKTLVQRERLLNDSTKDQSILLDAGAQIVSASPEIKKITPQRYLIPPGGEIAVDRLISSQRLFILGPAEGLSTALSLCFWAALAGTSPIWLFFVMQFVSPGLRSGERSLTLPFVIASVAALFSGIAFAVQGTIPIANQILMKFNEGLGENLWTLKQYITYSTVLMLGSGLAFEVAVIVFFLVHLGMLSPDGMRKRRRHVAVGTFVLAALLTPPDILTQILLAVPLLGLYELSIIYALMRTRALQPATT